MNCSQHHQVIKQVCLRQECSKSSLMCTECSDELHERHPFVGLQTLKHSIQRYLSRSVVSYYYLFNRLHSSAEEQFKRVEEDLATSQKSIQKQSNQLARLAEFFVNFKDQLLNLSDIGEAEVVESLLGQFEHGGCVSKSQLTQCLFRLFLNVRLLKRDEDEEELVWEKTPISFIKKRFLLGKKAEFSQVVKERVDEQSLRFERFFSRMGMLLQEAVKADENVEEKYEEFERNQRQQQVVVDGVFDREPFCQVWRKEKKSMDTGIGQKILFKLNHYLIFYTPLSCEMVVEEPAMRGEEANELNMPLKCRFCNLLRLKSFLSVYYRLDIVSRYGRLCQYTHDDQQYWVHELCLMWSNLIVIDSKLNEVNVRTLPSALQDAEIRQCRMCDLKGASMKCNNESCDIYYHFYCFKKSKLRGLQFDLKEKFRFFCEDHHGVKNFKGHSEWFLSRKRLKADVARNGISDLPKQHRQKIEIDNDLDVLNMAKRGRKRIEH